MKRNILLTLAALAASAHAGVTGLTNGDFETGTASAGLGSPLAVPGWYEQSAAPAWSDWVAKSASAGTFAGNVSALLAFSGANGYVYQQIGTYEPGLTVLFTGQVLQRAVVSSPNNGFTVELLAGDFAPADFTPLVATSLSSLTLDRTALTAAPYGFGAPSGGTSYAADFSLTLTTGTAGVAGEALWLRLKPVSASGEVFLDNLAVTAVPEPGAYGLMAAGALGLAVLRRRRR